MRGGRWSGHADARHCPGPRLLAIVHDVDHHVEIVVVRDVEGDFPRGLVEARSRIGLSAVEDEATRPKAPRDPHLATFPGAHYIKAERPGAAPRRPPRQPSTRVFARPAVGRGARS